VDPKSNKIQIKQAVEKLYGVKVKSVNTMITPSAEKKAAVVLEKELARRSWRRR
jgi:large subunit ribosomal protein L23